MNHRTDIFQHIISKTKAPPQPHTLVRGLRKKHAVISAAVAVVAKLNTLLALPPLINKTSERFRREGGRFPACITLSLNALWTLCLCCDTTNTDTHTAFHPSALSHSPNHVSIFTRKIFMLMLKNICL